MTFSRTKFFAGYRQVWGGLSQQQVDGLNFLLSAIENDPYITRVPWAAYLLATTKHETADTFQPIHEYGSHAYFVKRYGSQTAVGKRLGNDTPEEGADYAGVGDAQLTGESNFEKAEAALREFYPDVVAEFEARTGKKFDLTVGDQPNDKSDPQNAGDPAIAYCILSYGMRTGMFTGRRLTVKTDYKDWRRIINGTDKATLIAGYAKNFEKILTDSSVTSVPAQTPTGESNAIGIDNLPVQLPESTSEATDDKTLLQKADEVGDKVQSVNSTIEKFTFPSLPTGLGTRAMVIGMKAWATVLMVAGMLYEHRDYIYIAVILGIAGAWLWNESRKRNNPPGAGTVITDKRWWHFW